MQQVTTLEAMLRRDRVIVLVGLAVITLLAWAYIAYLARDMQTGMAMSSNMAMPLMQSWGAVDFALMFVMWAVMMTAMMVPTAAPMILVYASLNRRRRDPQPLLTSTAVFLLGYLVLWSGFAALATVAQWSLQMGALLSPMMVSASPILGGALLLAAGVFQLSPIKYACLANCRTPIGFLMTEWRDGPRGALVMGLRHGLYCLGCCWILMSLLFVLGVMNLLWIAALAGFVLVEKVVPRGRLVSRLSGLVLIGWSGWVVLEKLG